MTDLTENEQKHVRTALLYLRRQMFGRASVGRALGYQYDTVEKVANGRGRAPTASMAFRVARLVGVTVDDLIGGRFQPGACPKCGHVPQDGA